MKIRNVKVLRLQSQKIGKNKSFAVTTAKLDNNVKGVYNGFGDEK